MSGDHVYTEGYLAGQTHERQRLDAVYGMVLKERDAALVSLYAAELALAEMREALDELDAARADLLRIQSTPISRVMDEREKSGLPRIEPGSEMAEQARYGDALFEPFHTRVLSAEIRVGHARTALHPSEDTSDES